MTTYYRVRQPVSKFVVHPHYVTDADVSNEAIVHQPYRTTPLILPGAKVKKEIQPTECYLRHHPNPSMRGPVLHGDDVLKHKLADSMLHRVVGNDPRVSHKQFNSPLGLYSDNNIEHTIRTTVPNSTPYKKTVNYDPSKSETYRAIQEDYGGGNVHEVPIAVQGRPYQPNRLIPGKKPQSSYPPPQPQSYNNYYL